MCFDDQKHVSGAVIKIDGSFDREFSIVWQNVTDQMRRCWNDLEVTTENGAYAVALLLIKKLTDYTVVQRSRKGTGFDYWLGLKDDYLFQEMAKLEVSGIRNGTAKSISERKAIKIKQAQKTNNQLESYVVIVEFSTPISHMVTANGC